MIVDTLDQLEHYSALNRHFAKVCEFIKDTDLSSLADGKHVIDGDKVFAIVSHGQRKPKEQAILEIHRKYIDIQIVLSGSDEMGWKPLATVLNPQDEYNSENDYQLFDDSPDTWVKFLPGMFAIFFPADAHAPMAGDGENHKIVIKVMC